MMKKALGQVAKGNLEQLAKRVDINLKNYWEKEIRKGFGFCNSQRELTDRILNHASEHNLRSAKRLRAALIYYGFKLKGSNNREVWKVMEAMELVQTALLIHDDFMDEDVLRRGLPTTQVFFGEKNKHYGDSMAVDVGDLVLCLGYERMLECKLEEGRVLEATKLLMRGIAQTALGQAYDVSLPLLGDLTEEKVMAVHKTKTAIYTFQNPLLIGAVLAGVEEKTLSVLRKYAENAGVAFQIQDDILGVFGKMEKTGKSNDSDLLQGKSTLLIVKALEWGDEKQKKNLLEVWGNKKANKKEIEKAKEIIKETGSLDYSIKKAKEMAREAVASLKKMRNIKYSREAVDFLEGIAEYIVMREL